VRTPRAIGATVARKDRRRFRSGCVLLLAIGVSMGAPAMAQDSEPDQPGSGVPVDSAKGHGSVSIGYQDTFVNGMLLGGKPTDIGTVRIHAIDLDIDYNIADAWSVHAGIPFISSRFHDSGPNHTHNPERLDPPHPESAYLDNSPDYHSTFQDFSLGTSYRTHIDTYFITPSITARIPSHDYTFFANSAVGQDLKKLELAVSLEHQFDFTEIYYRARYAYVWAEKTLGISIDHSLLDLELGYFLNPRCSVKVFSLGKFGGGLQANQVNPLTTDNFTNSIWYHHDQISAHEYVNLGVGLDYNLGDKYTLSASAQKLVWGNTVYDFRYVLDVRLTRSF